MMEGHLFVVDPDTSRVISRVASLCQCETEAEVAQLVAQWQDRVGDDLVILDSRKYEWLVAPPICERLPSSRQPFARHGAGPKSAMNQGKRSDSGPREPKFRPTFLALLAVLAVTAFGLSGVS